MSDIYNSLCDRLHCICAQHDLLKEEVDVPARVLSSEEAIGSRKGNDFPLQQRKEQLMEARFGKSRGNRPLPTGSAISPAGSTRSWP